MKKIKSVLSLITVLTLLFTAAPFAYSAEDINSFSNSDTECEVSGRYFFLDEKSLIYEGLPGETEREYITSFAVDSVASYSGFVYAASGNSVYSINPDSALSRPVIAVAAKIDDFSLWNYKLFILSGGDITAYSLKNGAQADIITGRSITSMWFDGAALLSYMTDGELIYTLNLETEETSSDVNFASAFIGDIPVIIHEGEGNSPDTIGFSSLQAKFPAGMYWNHMGSSTNNPNGVTSKPCNHSAYGTNYCNRPSFWSASQCHGYALQCGYDVVGSNPMNWTKYTSSSSIDNVRAGDVIRLTYTNNLHTIYVLAVSGDNVIFTDCNSYGTCNIRWGASKSKSTLKSQFNYLLKCPVYLSDYYPGSGEIEFTIKFDLNDTQGKSRATCSETSRRVTGGEEYGELPVPVREGYDFLGWFTSASGGTQASDTAVAAGNATLYA
ncbi:MAG: InlB B-repeat-containing protein, partial [Clostridia bacterium]|nr:InlB B-repeat-containing protein [Clostridia bacterium]